MCQRLHRHLWVWTRGMRWYRRWFLINKKSLKRYYIGIKCFNQSQRLSGVNKSLLVGLHYWGVGFYTFFYKSRFLKSVPLWSSTPKRCLTIERMRQQYVCTRSLGTVRSSGSVNYNTSYRIRSTNPFQQVVCRLSGWSGFRVVGEVWVV